MEAAIYLRLSKDLAGTGAGVDRQKEDCLRRAAIDGVIEPRVFEDNDTSAFAKVTRPGFEQLLDLCRTGDIKVIYVYRIDRLARAAREWAKILPLVDDLGIRIVGVADGVDTATHGGRLILDVLAAVARDESARMSQRIKRQKASARALKLPMGGRRGFGSLPDEQSLLQEAARRVLAGDSQGTLAREWNRLGIRTSTGSTWSSGKVQRLLSHERCRPILGDMVWLELQHLYSGRRRPGRPASALLSGVLRCTCGQKMISRSVHNKSKRYTCKSCHLSIQAPGTDSTVTEALLKVLAVQGYWDEAESNTEPLEGLTGHLEALQGRRSQLLRNYYITASIPEDDFTSLMQDLQAQIDTLEERLVRINQHGRTGKASLENFDQLSIESKREILSEVFEYIQVKPADRKHPVPPADRLLLKFRDEELPLLASSLLAES